MADTRTCEQCGIVFTPGREHARFCSAACRVAWNQEHTGNPQAGASALDWSVTAMHDAVERLAREQPPDQAHGFEMISDAVWRVTLVDATLVRYHQRAYEAVMRARDPAARQAVEGTLAGLRFVRNRMGYHADPAEFIQPGHGRPGSGNGAAAWRWRSLPEPALASLPPRGRAWEITRYRAYQAQLAGHTIGETFGRAAAFLKLASANPTAALPADPRFTGAGVWPKTVGVIGCEFAGLWLSSRLCAGAHQGSSMTPSRAHGQGPQARPVVFDYLVPTRAVRSVMRRGPSGRSHWRGHRA